MLRHIRVTLHRKKNRFFTSKVMRCKECGSKGNLASYADYWHIYCLGSHCTNTTNLHMTRFGAIREWNNMVKNNG